VCTFGKKYLAFCFSADYLLGNVLSLTVTCQVAFAEGLLMLSCDLRRIVALTMVVMTALVTMPLSAADFSTTKSVIGSVSAVGPVELRGIGISQEGTLFSGDSIRSGQKGYAKVLLGTGGKIELGEKTDVKVGRDAQGVKLTMNTGMIGFTAHTPLRIDVMPFELTATDDSAGNVAIIGSKAAGVRTLNGKVTLRNLKTSESFVLLKGQEMLISLKDGVSASSSLAELASNAPTPLPAPTPAPAPRPAPAPQAPAPGGRSTGGLDLDTGAWIAIIGGAAVTGIAIWGLVQAINDRNDIKALKTRVNALTPASQSRP
jgi:hypothetical protein